MITLTRPSGLAIRIDRKAIAYVSETANGAYVILKLKQEDGRNMQFQVSDSYAEIQDRIDQDMAREMRLAELKHGGDE